MTALSPVSIPDAVDDSPDASPTNPQLENYLSCARMPSPEAVAGADAHGKSEATSQIHNVFAKVDEEGAEKLAGTPLTSVEKPGVSSSTTLECASSDTTEDAESTIYAVDKHHARMDTQHAPTQTSSVSAPSNTTGTSTSTKTASPKTSTPAVAAAQKVVQIIEQYLSAQTIQQCAELALSTSEATASGVDEESTAPNSMHVMRPLLPCVDSHVTIPILSLLQLETLMAAVRSGLDEAATVGQTTTTTAIKSTHSVLQQVCFLLEALCLSKLLVVREDLVVKEAETATVVLPVDVSELRHFRVGPSSHATPGVRCTLLLECAAEDSEAVRTLDKLCVSRLRTVLHDGAAGTVVVACMEAPNCLAVTFTDRPSTQQGFVQLQECAPYKAGLITVRMRVENASSNNGSAREGIGAAAACNVYGLSRSVDTPEGNRRRWSRLAPRSAPALARALALAKAAAADRPEPAVRAAIAGKTATTTDASNASSSSPRFAPECTVTMSKTAETASPTPHAHACAPTPIDGDGPAPAVADTLEAAHVVAPSTGLQKGLNLSAAPFVPRSLRGLGGSLDDLAYALDTQMTTASTSASHTPAVLSRGTSTDVTRSSSGRECVSQARPPQPAWPAQMDESERLAAQMLLDSQNGLFTDPFGGVPPQPIVPWEDGYGTYSVSVASVSSTPQPPSAHAHITPPATPGTAPHAIMTPPRATVPACTGSLGLAPLGTDTPLTTPMRSYGRPSVRCVPPAQPHAVDDAFMLPSASPKQALALLVPSAASQRSTPLAPQPPVALAGEEPASLPDPQMARSPGSRRWCRNDPYSLVVAVVETSAPSSLSLSLASDQLQRSPFYRSTLLTPASGGVSCSPTFVNPAHLMSSRSRLFANGSSVDASTDAVAELSCASGPAHGASPGTSTDERKPSARVLTFAEVLQRGRVSGATAKGE